MARAFPDWQPFDQDGEDSSPLELSGRHGPALVLLASPNLDANGWAGRVAIHLAGLRSGLNGRLLLADLGLEAPRLHEVLGVQNGEGVSDAFLYGASIQRIASRVDGGFLFASAGTAVADTRSVLASDRWDAMLEGFERAGADLFLYVPWNTEGWEELLARARNVVILAGKHEIAALSLPDGVELRVGAVLGPPVGGATADDFASALAAASATDSDVVPEEEEVHSFSSDPSSPEDDVSFDADASEHDYGPTVAETESGDYELGAVAETVPDESGWETDDPSEGGLLPESPATTTAAARLDAALESRNRPRPPFVRIIGAGALLAVVVFLILRVTAQRTNEGLDDTQANASQVAGVEEAPVAEATSQPDGEGPATDQGSDITPSQMVTSAESGDATRQDGADTPQSLDWTVQVASYPGLDEAGREATALQDQFASALFMIVPADVNGRTWYRIMGGPHATMDEASAFRDQLARSRGMAPEQMLVRTTRFAVLVERADDPGRATARVDELRRIGIPAYVLEDRSSDRPFAVFVGAFQSEGDADASLALLEEAGVTSAELVRRIGTPVGS